jgi:hypothetical protein
VGFSEVLPREQSQVHQGQPAHRLLYPQDQRVEFVEELLLILTVSHGGVCKRATVDRWLSNQDDYHV